MTQERFTLDRRTGDLRDSLGRRFDPVTRAWSPPPGGPVAPGSSTVESVDATSAAAWLQRNSGCPVRVPVGVIGPRAASPAQMNAAEAIGFGLAELGVAVLCGGREGVMQAVCAGVARGGGLSLGFLPDTDPSLANPHVSLVLATGIGEARNALIARASLCLVAIGNSFGTLSEVALGRQFGKTVIGLLGAPEVEGVIPVDRVEQALARVSRVVLALP